MDDAVYDMGGVREWFGPIPVEANEPVFHYPWQAHVCVDLLQTCAMLGISEEGFRWAEERLPRAQYLVPYWQIWLNALEQMVVDKGALAPGELDADLAGKQPKVRGHVQPGVLTRAGAGWVLRTLMGPMPPWMARLVARIQGMLPGVKRFRFATGDRVRVSSAPPTGHTRRPRYMWGKRGTIIARQDTAVLPESSARGEHRPREHIYTVEFDGRELWGDGTEPGTVVRIDLWESYLESTP